MRAPRSFRSRTPSGTPNTETRSSICSMAGCGRSQREFLPPNEVDLGGGRGGLLAFVQVIQRREQKNGGRAGQSANDEENTVGVNQSVAHAQAFDSGS